MEDGFGVSEEDVDIVVGLLCAPILFLTGIVGRNRQKSRKRRLRGLHTNIESPPVVWIFTPPPPTECPGI